MTEPSLSLLHDALVSGGAVIDGVSVRDWSDRSTWTIWRDGGEIRAVDDPSAKDIVQSIDVSTLIPVSQQDAMTKIADDLAMVKAAIMKIDPSAEVSVKEALK